MSFDPLQRFIQMLPGGQGILYLIQADGDLLWYRNFGWQNGTSSWANGGNGLTIGTAWNQFVTVLTGANGQFFAFRADGTLFWYQYVLTNSSTGAGFWASGSGSQIGSGWNVYPRVFGGFDNVIYALDAAGVLYWYHYAGTSGEFNWANGGNRLQIGVGWTEYPYLYADPNGVIYGVRQGDDLRWWRYVVQNYSTGSGSWANGGNSITIGVGWGDDAFRATTSNGSGTFYGIQVDLGTVPASDDTLVWYRLFTSENVDTAGVSWANGGSAITVGSGFTWQNSAALQGYPSTLSVAQGGSVGIQVSTTFGSYTSAVFREAPATTAAVQVVGPAAQTGRLQLLPSAFRSAGCGWSTDFSVSVPSTWQPGVYSARLTSPWGTMYPVVFVVRPSAPAQKLAVVVPTNTYNAYNPWGGHDQYTNGQTGVQRTVTLRRPSVSTSTGIAPSGFINHLLYSDLLLLRWMTTHGIAYDCYEDGDLDATGSTWLPSYKAVVLTSHPEYFTSTMRQNLINYTNAGGRIVSTGGNAIYEQVSYTPDRSAVVYRTVTGARNLFINQGLPEAQVIGVNFFPDTYMDFAPYQVKTMHAFLNGTGLTVGSTFGASGYNEGASGWELDEAPAGGAATVIASGLNPNGGADMTYLTTPLNGWVFSTSSLSFNGAINDAVVTQIMLNVFNSAVA